MYRLRCMGCGSEWSDDGLITACPNAHAPALLRTVYETAHFQPDPDAEGIARYQKWLPVRAGGLPPCPRTAVFQSAALCEALQAPNLWLAFNGFWPQRGALLPTATFKDLESAAVLARFPATNRTLVAASAGNTAAALARAASDAGVHAVIVVPEQALSKLRFSRPLNSCVRVFCVPGDASYDDAIACAKSIASANPRHAFEGGAANVARRDGIGTTMLAAAEQLGRLPGYFAAAIGSGAGAIAAHEAALRLREDGRFGDALPKLLLVQNAPSAPVYESWKRRSGTLISYGDRPEALRARLRSLSASVLSTQTPPYAIRGGLYDVLTESRGDVCVADNAAAVAARALFEHLEGVTLEPAAAVALAGLQGALDRGEIPRAETIVLHITGGGAAPNRTYAPDVVEAAA
ncbi:MAG TPA: cysteate synthase [Candidatus Baltobacteraceae bacterium]|nr:cysteate synthase [Candidatus Baltobacteraceae bacterium]